MINIIRIAIISHFIGYFFISPINAASKEKALLSPEAISYEGVPGYNPRMGEVLEWSKANGESPQLHIPSSIFPQRGLRIRWMGTFGYEISDDETTLLIDPFVSRPTPLELFSPLEIDTQAVKYYILSSLKKERISVILITHSHYDHLEDVPYILSQFTNPDNRPLVVGDPNMKSLLQAYKTEIGIPWSDTAGGLDNTRTIVVDFLADAGPIPIGQFGRFKITAFRSIHPKYDFIPWRGPAGIISGSPPFRANQYPLYHDISTGYLVEYSGLKIYFSDSPTILHPEEIGPVDILIQTIAARRAENNIPEALSILNPEYYIPAHYDNFFKPLSQFDTFDFVIGIELEENNFLPDGTKLLDFSRFEEFIDEYYNIYITSLQSEGLNNTPNQPKLRLLKMFYYYSLVNLIER